MPARHREMLAAVVARPGIGDHRDVRSVRQQVRPRALRVRRGVDAGVAAVHGTDGRDVVGELDRRIFERDLVRDALLQQQVGGLHARLGVESTLHREVVQRVVE